MNHLQNKQGYMKIIIRNKIPRRERNNDALF